MGLHAEFLAEDSALGGGDGVSVESVDLIGGAGAETSHDAGGENRREVADRRVVVQPALHDEPAVFGCQCGVGLSGQVGGQEQGGPQPGVTCFGGPGRCLAVAGLVGVGY